VLPLPLPSPSTESTTDGNHLDCDLKAGLVAVQEKLDRVLASQTLLQEAVNDALQHCGSCDGEASNGGARDEPPALRGAVFASIDSQLIPHTVHCHGNIHPNARSLQNHGCMGEPPVADNEFPEDPIEHGIPKLPSPECLERHTSFNTSAVEIELHSILQITEQAASLKRQRTHQENAFLGGRLTCIRPLQDAMHSLVWGHVNLESWIDSFFGAIIVLNALWLGWSPDVQGNIDVWAFIVDVSFRVLFWLEQLLKIYLFGFRQVYCGGSGTLHNLFDATLVIADSVHLFIALADGETMTGVSASLFRVVRLVRLARILRLLRSSCFQELLSMIQGMMGAASTLLWSLVLLLVFLYVASLVFREILGSPGEASEDGIVSSEQMVAQYFTTVPIAMMTTFRCSFGDCAVRDGTPLLAHISDISLFWSYVFSGFLFLAVIGLFNVISAIFVESSLQAAAVLHHQRKQMKLDDENVWAENVMVLLRALDSRLIDIGECGLQLDGRNTKKKAEAILCVDVSRSVLDHIIFHDKTVMQALLNLDIDQQDHKHLSDILDPDNSGSISMVEFIDGLKRLRGDARRSDIITVDLMIRSLQERIEEMLRILEEMHGSSGNQGAVVSQQAAVNRGPLQERIEEMLRLLEEMHGSSGHQAAVVNRSV